MYRIEEVPPHDVFATKKGPVFAEFYDLVATAHLAALHRLREVPQSRA